LQHELDDDEDEHLQHELDEDEHPLELELELELEHEQLRLQQRLQRTYSLSTSGLQGITVWLLSFLAITSSVEVVSSIFCKRSKMLLVELSFCRFFAIFKL
jgi:hypothetical protein